MSKCEVKLINNESVSCNGTNEANILWDGMSLCSECFFRLTNSDQKESE